MTPVKSSFLGLVLGVGQSPKLLYKASSVGELAFVVFGELRQRLLKDADNGLINLLHQISLLIPYLNGRLLHDFAPRSL